MNTILLYSIPLLAQFSFAQNLPKEGFIPIDSGLLYYYSQPKNSYTLELQGNVNTKDFPIVSVKDKVFEFQSISKALFGEKEKEILLNYMAWEVDYIHDKISNQATFDHEFIHTENRDLINFWSFKNPNNISVSKIKRTYYFDFIKKNSLYRFTYFSNIDNELNAKEFFLSLKNNMTFYSRKINIPKLKKKIKVIKNKV